MGLRSLISPSPCRTQERRKGTPMNAIVSVTQDWGIGKNNRLLVRNREDMLRFKQLTMGGTVVMGRKTFESFPAGPLKGRRNIVVTRDAHYADAHPGIECATSPMEALLLAKADSADKVWLIGGESLYRELLPYCERCLVTRNQVSVPADAYFPNLDEDSAWELECVEGSSQTPEGIPYDFATYRNLDQRDSY